MKPDLYIESFAFRLVKCLIAITLIFVVLFKPFISSILELNKETIELTSNTSEEEVTEVVKEEVIQNFFSCLDGAIEPTQEEPRQMAFSSIEEISGFRQEINLPPPQL